MFQLFLLHLYLTILNHKKEAYDQQDYQQIYLADKPDVDAQRNDFRGDCEELGNQQPQRWQATCQAYIPRPPKGYQGTVRCGNQMQYLYQQILSFIRGFFEKQLHPKMAAQFVHGLKHDRGRT